MMDRIDGFFTSLTGYRSSSNRGNQRPSAQVPINGKQKPLSRSGANVEHNISPTTVTGRPGQHANEIKKPDQAKHKNEEIKDRKNMHSLEVKLAKEIEASKRLDAALAVKEHMLQEKEKELTSIKDVVYRREQEIRELLADKERQSAEIQQEKEELRRVNVKYQQINQLLQERSEELSTAQQFLGKADNISPGEVARLVEVLNGEIAQQSNFIVDSLTYQKWTGSENYLENLLKGLHDILGPWLYNNLLRRLIDPELEFDYLIMQLALQTGLIRACNTIINHWDPLSRHVYGDMRKKFGQVVAGRWRALSSTCGGVDREGAAKHLRAITRKLIIAVGGAVQNGDFLPSDLGRKVDDITRKALKIHEHVRSSLTSVDIETYFISSGDEFDASLMKDADGPEEGKGKAVNNNNRQSKVICTVEMGLQYRKGISSGKQNEFREETGIILKSKVVLADALADYGIDEIM